MSTSSTISKSTQTATLLVLLQVSSRGFTFVVNQILLRYLSPTLLGISQQLELFAISVLYFSRESLRVALQRQSVDTTNSASSTRDAKSSSAISSVERSQGLVNLSYIPVLLGPILAVLFAWLYLAKAASETLEIPFFQFSLRLFCIAAVVELTVEPCFALTAQSQNIRLRAAAETTATISRCVVTVASAIWGSRNGYALGALPFALGQGAYAAGLWIVYYGYILTTKDKRISLMPKRLGSATNILSLFPHEPLALAGSLWAQSGLKHILTQGDALLITFFADLPSQGIFALASNYGSLLARIMFQPIEESSRSFFGRSLSTSSADKTSEKQKKPSIDNLKTAYTYFTTLLRFYSHLALLLLVIAPPLSTPLLSILAGKIWRSSNAPRILSKYCYYLPLLAYNGLLEAFVAATASPAELRKQSIAMLFFSAIFATAGYVLLGILSRKVDGIIEANMCNMAVRIVWSKAWVENWWDDASDQADSKEKGVPVLRIFSSSTLPHPVTLAISAATWAFMRQSLVDVTLRAKTIVGTAAYGSILDTVVDIAVVGAIGLPMLSSIVWYEWDSFVGPTVQKALSIPGLGAGLHSALAEKKSN